MEILFVGVSNPEKITEFYNACHASDGRFCPTSGGVSGRATLLDSDGDPNKGAKEINGVKGYDSKGKPVPGSDAWLEAHGVSPQIFSSRPYVKYESQKDDPAILEAFKDYPAAQKFWQQRAAQEGQTGGYIMYKHQVPGSPYGPVAPQVRPNKAVVTNPAIQAQKAKILENDKLRLETLKKVAPGALVKERRAQVKQAELNLERIKVATPEKVRKEAFDNLNKAQEKLKTAKEGKNGLAILEAQQELISVKRAAIRDNNRANNWRPDKELYDAETAVKYANNRVVKALENPQEALKQEIKSQEARIKRSENRLEKTAAKYVFSKGTSSARIDMNPDPQNIKNLVDGKGRIYLAMEGSIKADAVLTAAKREDPTAAVVNVPSVTLWQEKGGAAGEIRWFTEKYGKGRQVILIPDADGVNNPNVMAQAKALSTALRNFGAGDVVLASPPLKKGTRKVIDHFELPSGVDEGRKGVDDHLGGGRGTLGQLQYSKNVKVPSYDLTEYSKAPGKGGPGGNRINDNSIRGTEKALAAISGIVGPEGSSRITKKMLAQAAGLAPTSALEARGRLEKLGIISVEHIFDEQALSRGKRIRNPLVSDDRVQELVRRGIIKEPRLDQPFTEVTIEESPVITIRDSRYRIKQEDIEIGTLDGLKNFKPPKDYDGWRSSVTGKRDTTGLAERVAQTGGQKVRKARAPVEAAPGRRIVRTKEGAARYGVPINSPIPILSSRETTIPPLLGETVSMILQNPPSITQFFNPCHGANDGKFCPTTGGKGGGGLSGLSKGAPWPARSGRKVTTVASGRVTVDGIKAKAVYEVGEGDNRVRLYDKTGKAGPYREAMLNNHARMQEMYGLGRNLVVVSPNGMVKLAGLADRRTFSVVNHGDKNTYINSAFLGIDVGKLPDGWMMPGSKNGNTKNMDYILTHEYGHHVDFSRNVVGGTIHKSNALLEVPGAKNSLSRYGRLNDVEAYAEAFSEWHHSNGQTRNPLAVAMAKSEGWYGSGITASALGGDTMYLERVVNPLFSFVSSEGTDLLSLALEGETDDIEDDLKEGKGISAIDDFINGAKESLSKSERATDEEVKRAEKLFREVLKELGVGE